MGGTQGVESLEEGQFGGSQRTQRAEGGEEGIPEGTEHLGC